MPEPIRRLVSAYQAAVCRGNKFPNSKYLVSTGYLFLRLIVPFITQPDKFGMTLRPIDDRDRRNLTLVAKVLQNLANQRRFGDKEGYMKAMNPFVDEALKQLQAYINTLGESGCGSMTSHSPAHDDSTIADLMVLHRSLLQVILRFFRFFRLLSFVTDFSQTCFDSRAEVSVYATRLRTAA